MPRRGLGRRSDETSAGGVKGPAKRNTATINVKFDEQLKNSCYCAKHSPPIFLVSPLGCSVCSASSAVANGTKAAELSGETKHQQQQQQQQRAQKKAASE